MIDEPPLSGSHYDRAALYRSDEQWVADAWRRAQVVLIDPRSTTPVADGRIVPVPSAAAPDGVRRFLGVVDDVPYFAVTTERPANGPADGGADEAADAAATWLTLREFGARADDLEADLVVSAVALEQWHQRHPRCPRCGAATVETKAGWTRTCTVDGSEHFPRTDPAVIMLIVDDSTDVERALLGRGPQWGAGRFSTLAGFVEPGESLEAAVAREVFEEVGVRIRDVRYVASQPWPFPASLMIGFVARLDGGAAITLDPVEMAEAGWFTRAEVQQAADWTDSGDPAARPEAEPDRRLRGISPRFSISRYLIDQWLAGAIGAAGTAGTVGA